VVEAVHVMEGAFSWKFAKMVKGGKEGLKPRSAGSFLVVVAKVSRKEYSRGDGYS